MSGSPREGVEQRSKEETGVEKSETDKLNDIIALATAAYHSDSAAARAAITDEEREKHERFAKTAKDLALAAGDRLLDIVDNNQPSQNKKIGMTR